jgi:hypothetical protein
MLTHNVLTALKRIALPEPWLRARPKRLRFQICVSPGKLIHHARRVLSVSCSIAGEAAVGILKADAAAATAQIGTAAHRPCVSLANVPLPDDGRS